MREYKFRGKRVDNGEWVYGSLIKVYAKPHKVYIPFGCKIQKNIDHEYAVIPDSVGQFTGLHDKNGKEIYEGDILRNPPKDKWEEKNFVSYEVFYHDNDCADNHVGFQFNRLHFRGSLCGGSFFEKFLPKYTAKMEIIGSVYENPEILGGR